jgi:hypothetical protein
MRAAPALGLCALLLAASGCMPVYKLAPGEPSAPLQLAYPQQAAWICDQGPRMRLRTERDGSVRIPVGRRITLGVQLVTGTGPQSIACAPAVNLVPAPGAGYYQDFELDGYLCHTWVYRQAPQEPRTGLAHEPSLAAGRFGCEDAGTR